MLRPCCRPNCPELVPRGYCARHALAKAAFEQRLLKESRLSTSARGYDRRWKQFRLEFLARHPNCNDCGEAAAKDVHHVKKIRDFPELRLDPANCRGLCKRCHAKRTMRGE